MTEHYTWRFVEDKGRNLGVHEVTRGIEGDLPFTVIVTNYSVNGDRMFFNDLFWTSAWDATRGDDEVVSTDLRFSLALWKHLEMEGEMEIEHDLQRVPVIYRRCLEEAMFNRYGIKSEDIPH